MASSCVEHGDRSRLRRGLVRAPPTPAPVAGAPPVTGDTARAIEAEREVRGSPERADDAEHREDHRDEPDHPRHAPDIAAATGVDRDPDDDQAERHEVGDAEQERAARRLPAEDRREHVEFGAEREDRDDGRRGEEGRGPKVTRDPSEDGDQQQDDQDHQDRRADDHARVELGAVAGP